MYNNYQQSAVVYGTIIFVMSSIDICIAVSKAKLCNCIIKTVKVTTVTRNKMSKPNALVLPEGNFYRIETLHMQRLSLIPS